MAQRTKECKITLEDKSYKLLYKILQQYEKPYLRKTLLEQIAYNCAIRSAYYTFASYKTGRTHAFHKGGFDFAHYGLSNFDGSSIYSYKDEDGVEHEKEIAKYDTDKTLYLHYPFIHNDNSNDIPEIDSYPKVQKLLTEEQYKQIQQMVKLNVQILPALERTTNFPDKLYDDSKNNKIKFDPQKITEAFFYFDAMYFYDCNLSMIVRSPKFKKTTFKYQQHDIRKIKPALKVMKYLILENKYFDLI